MNKFFSLSYKLLGLTLLFVLLAEILIFVPSAANFRRNWISDKVTAAKTAALIIEAAPDGMIPKKLVDEILDNNMLTSVAKNKGNMQYLLANKPELPQATVVVNLSEMSFFGEITATFELLLAKEPRMMRVLEGMKGDAETLDVLVSEEHLKTSLINFSKNIIWLSLLISTFTALLVFASLQFMLVRPMQKLTANMMRFSENPEDKASIIKPSNRRDEIGLAEKQLQGMQQDLHKALKTKNHLAELGLSLSKITHDLRNMLTIAHLFSDRVASIKDENVQKFAPKLVAALDRAIHLCTSTLTFGKAEEKPLQKTNVNLQALINDVIDQSGETKAEIVNEINANFTVKADYEQLFRVFMNLTKNALEALEKQGNRLTFSAKNNKIYVEDNGIGFTNEAKAKLFTAFNSNAKHGGTGLGLTIARDIIEAHGGKIELLNEKNKTIFSISLALTA